MAKRVVVFDNSGSSPTVITRRKKAPEASPPAAAKAAKPAKEKLKASATQAPVKAAAKKAAKPDPVNMDANKATENFKNRYLDELRTCLEGIEHALADESRPDRDYYLLRRDFLGTLLAVVENDDGTNLGEFAPLAEPFFWDEFARLAWIRATGPKNETAHGSRVAPTWRKAGVPLFRVLMRNLNQVRSKRDNFVLKTPPITRRDVIMSVNGALLYLNKDIEAQPDNQELCNLREIYERMYKKSGLQAKAVKLADYIVLKREAKPDFSIWRNEDTVNYLLAQRKKQDADTE